jgi:uncharacterized lipoprotein NlpE involved in copper resistance
MGWPFGNNNKKSTPPAGSKDAAAKAAEARASKTGTLRTPGYVHHDGVGDNDGQDAPKDSLRDADREGNDLQNYLNGRPSSYNRKDEKSKTTKSQKVGSVDAVQNLASLDLPLKDKLPTGTETNLRGTDTLNIAGNGKAIT